MAIRRGLRCRVCCSLLLSCLCSLRKGLVQGIILRLIQLLLHSLPSMALPCLLPLRVSADQATG